MGASNFVKNPGRREKRQFSLKGLALKIDLPLLITVVLLLIIGLIMVYSSSMQYAVLIDTDKPAALFQRQAIFVIGGLVAGFVAYRFDYHWLKPLAPYIMGTIIVLLIIVLMLPVTENEPKRTLFGGSVQPSELAKVVVIIYLSVWIGQKKDQLNLLASGIIPMILILSTICVLIMLQPDNSAMLTILFLGILLFVIGEGNVRLVIPVVIFSLTIFGIAYITSGTVQSRLDGYFASMNSMETLDYHIQQALSAIIRGGWFGTNLGEGTAKYIGLPVPWTDSIFAVILEELGFWGGTFIVFLYLVILFRGFKIAEDAPDLSGKLLASGLTSWIVFEAFINMGVMVRLFPVAGNALPLISYGGSMMMTTLGSLGLIFSVNRSTIEKQVGDERRSLDAAVDLRGRNGRRRVSRVDRSKRTRKYPT
ncbi:MAG: FtsW/RodA/SpoVE family cell cycle protein [Anaerolineaceae bacterium]|nr:FtsW/RodA/SpoVE family cell cycle protein [Anaerolineaceae bacterium]